MATHPHPPDLVSAIATLPKAELHVHLDEGLLHPLYERAGAFDERGAMAQQPARPVTSVDDNTMLVSLFNSEMKEKELTRP